MFWSDWGVNGRIESAYMDGTGRRALVDTMVQWPTGLAIDYPARRLYWTDPKAYTIESVNLNGQDRQVIRRFPHSKSQYHQTERHHELFYCFPFFNGKDV